MTHGSLSSGIGGFDIGAEANGIRTKWTCEIDPLRRDILQWQFPKAKHYTDLRKLRKPKYVDIISFGFPCQDISQANPHGKGLEGEKSSLFYEGWRIICINRPRYIVFENSQMLLHKGLTTILGLLAQQGYNAEWQIISCKQFGLPHLRKRLFIIAYSNENGRNTSRQNESGVVKKEHRKKNSEGKICSSEPLRSVSYEDWRETIRKFHHLDDGIPFNIFQGLLASAGDTVSPKITNWIFSRIKEKEIERLAESCL